ncbi:MAG: hypothetical protein HPY82_16930 [Gammaproteobacteria bacterium]|nr:hypothetical protein [Gammaproteobacteria bacterium]
MIILDIEASGLDLESYPIEIAWQHRSNPKLFDSFFICPESVWTYWDQYAEDHIHHISRSTIQAEGIDVRAAATRLNDALGEHEVYSDSLEYDGRWLGQLYRAAQIEKRFRLMSVYSLIDPSKVVSFQHRYAQSGIKHRALSDVKKIIECINYYASW